MTWTLVIAVAAFAAGWYFGRLERTGCEAWAEALFSDLGAAQAELQAERHRADDLAEELALFLAGKGFDPTAYSALADHDEARGRS